MHFECEWEGVEFSIVIEADTSYSPPQKLIKTSKKDRKAIESGEIKYCSLTITSTKEGKTLTHYNTGYMMDLSSEDCLDQLEDILAQHKVLDSILDQWDLLEEDGPGY
ncbi:MAG: hypothetical protein HN509_05905 [Halobacteriovoraceae bacterium]|jgi:hypothetical protein|nr:hypothetical protein [Halobacteriovoraceae bacterium]MBT5094692.1 hypothetical protein [Halobacteriovoraceae bacterium]